MFFDWLNVWQQFDGDWPDLVGGRVVSIEGSSALQRGMFTDRLTGENREAWGIAGGEIDYDVAKFEAHRGSFETTLMIRMVAGRLEVRGNPSSWGRLDNLFGVGLDDGIAIYNDVLERMGLPTFTEGEVRTQWMQATGTMAETYTGAHISRVDCTENYAVGMGNVKAFNKWLAGQKMYRSAPDDEQLATFARWDFSTVYMSESKYWITAKSYDKSKALLDVSLPQYLKKLKAAAKAGNINKADVQRLFKEAEDYLDGLSLWCAEQGIARLEWSFRNRWFAQHQELRYWRPGVTEGAILDVVGEELDKIMKRVIVVQDGGFDALTDKEFRVLSDWKKGEDLLALGKLSKSAFYRFRTTIREKTGMDIGARPVQGRVIDQRPVFFRVRSVSLNDSPIWYQRPLLPQRLAA